MKKPTKKKDKSRIKSGTIETPPGTMENPEEHPDDIIQEKTQEDIDREWRCLTCSATAPSTTSGYMTLIKHQCTGEKKIRLIALETGEELAASFREALNAGLLAKLKEERGPGEKQDSSRGAPQVAGDNIRITISLPRHRPGSFQHRQEDIRVGVNISQFCSIECSFRWIVSSEEGCVLPKG